MSENQENNALQEVSRKVVITPEDCQGAAEFWTHFEVPMPEELKLAFDTFAADPTFENQDKIRLTIARAIAYTPHDAFRDHDLGHIAEVASPGRVLDGLHARAARRPPPAATRARRIRGRS